MENITDAYHNWRLGAEVGDGPPQELNAGRYQPMTQGCGPQAPAQLPLQ